MTPILRGTLAALAFTSTVWLAATPAAADDFKTCASASGDEAIAACTRAINSGRYSGRQLADLFVNRCAELIGKQENDKAIEDCSQAIQLNANGADAFSNRSGAYRAKGQYDRAIEDYNEPIRLNPNYAAAFYNRCLSWEHKNDLQTRVGGFQEVLRIGPVRSGWSKVSCARHKGVERSVTAVFSICHRPIDSLRHDLMSQFGP